MHDWSEKLETGVHNAAMQETLCRTLTKDTRKIGERLAANAEAEHLNRDYVELQTRIAQQEELVLELKEEAKQTLEALKIV